METKGVKRLQSVLKKGNSAYSIDAMKKKGLVKSRAGVITLTKKGESVERLFRK